MISIKQVNSLYIILASFVVALIIILMIYDSNLTTLENKISATANPNAEQPQVSNESAMQMMESIQTLMKALAEDPDNYNLNVQAANANFDISRFDIRTGLSVPDRLRSRSSWACSGLPRPWPAA